MNKYITFLLTFIMLSYADEKVIKSDSTEVLPTVDLRYPLMTIDADTLNYIHRDGVIVNDTNHITLFSIRF
jgi:hypothetical protein